MATSIGQLAVLLTLNNKGFASKMEESQRQSKNFAKQMDKMSTSIRRLGATAATTAIAGLTTLVAQQSRAIDQTAKLTRRIGANTDGFIGLAHAAEQTAGVGEKTLGVAMQRMTRRISEAANGTGEAIKALDELAISAESLSRMRADQQFKAVADAMRSVEDQGDRVRLTVKLFDSEGVALVNTLALGSKELEKFSRQAEGLGLMLGGSAEGVEAMNDQFDLLNKQIKGLGRQATTTLAPIVSGIIDIGLDIRKAWTSAFAFTVDNAAFAASLLNNRAGNMLGTFAEDLRRENKEMRDTLRVIETPDPTPIDLDEYGKDLEKKTGTAFIKAFDFLSNKAEGFGENIADSINHGLTAMMDAAEDRMQQARRHAEVVADALHNQIGGGVGALERGSAASFSARMQHSRRGDAAERAQIQTAANTARLVDLMRDNAIPVAELF